MLVEIITKEISTTVVLMDMVNIIISKISGYIKVNGKMERDKG